ncbi:ciliary basal body-associated, B9 protein-domain-containing protein [Phlyctochytrium arcticum]|nr:ciliary basal body-associated, B9 protein-domain-containing protein [Phlyctochytrium arcticum]
MSTRPLYTTDNLTTAVYRTFDPIKYLKIKVRLAKIADKHVPLVIGRGVDGDEEMPDRRTLLPKPEVAIIDWQQKVFSPGEILKYKTVTESSTDLAKTYAQQILNLSRTPKTREARVLAAGRTRAAKKGIYTMTHQDAYFPPELLDSGIDGAVGDPTERTDGTRLIEGVWGFDRVDEDQDEQENQPRYPIGTSTGVEAIPQTMYQRRKPHAPFTHQRRDLNVTSRPPAMLPKTRSDIVSDEPIHRTRPLLQSGYEDMHIMAYIHPEDTTTPGGGGLDGIEKRLCTIRAYDNGMVTCTPPFQTRGHKITYRFTIGQDIYEYALKVISDHVTDEEAQAEMELVEAYHNEIARLRSLRVGKEFTKIPEYAGRRVTLFGEIVSADGFKGGIYVRSKIDVPSGWTIESGAADSRTQVGRERWDSERGVWTIGFACGFELGIVTYRTDSDIRWPKVYLHVGSLDWWGRPRTEGYAYVEIPRNPGMTDINVQCWKPFGTYQSRLRESFIGGGMEIEDLAYIGIPDEAHDQRKLVKYGWQTETTGSVRVRLQTVHQTEYVIALLGAHCKLIKIGKQRIRERHFDTGRDMNLFVKSNLQAITDALVRARARVKALQEDRRIRDMELEIR